MKKNWFSTLVTGFFFVCAAPGFAAGEWTISPGVSYYVFDSDRNLEDEAGVVLGLEKSLSDEWGLEVKLATYEADVDNSLTGATVDLNAASLDLLRYFSDGNWQPYVAMGLGHGEFESANSISGETQFNAGGGLRYFFNKNWSTRFDFRVVNGLDVEQTDAVASLMLGFSFGGTSKKESPADSDGDGVVDSRDRCVNTPVGVVVDANGCPLDTDRDGVADYMDKCPQTPRGRQVDEAGCKFVLTRSEEIRMAVNFPVDSAEVPDQFLPEIEKVARFLKKYGGVDAVVEGHADDTGAAAYNKNLSQRRADAVKAELVTRYGIDASRLTAIGYGEERPIASNETREGRRENRRVVAVVKAEVTE